MQVTSARPLADWSAVASRPGSGNYLNDLFSWSQLVLSMFAIFVILRHCVQRCPPWLTRIDAKNAAYSTQKPNFSAGLHSHQERHHHHHLRLRHRPRPPLPWFYHLPEMMAEKQRDRSFSKTPTGPAAAAISPVGAIKTPPPPPSSSSRQEPQRLEPQRLEQQNALATGRNTFALTPSWNSYDGSDRHLISRPPPAPPLTPPDLSNTVYTLDGRPASQGVSDSFMHQPNPDYTGSFMSASQSSAGSSHRRSYSKTVPIGIPRRQSTASELDPADLTTSPNSYPPTSPILPPPPPATGTMAGPPYDGQGKPWPESRHEMDARGEFVSVRNSDGASWTRHTRVYGGGVCLACAAAGEEGGFYGANVRPDEMR